MLVSLGLQRLPAPSLEWCFRQVWTSPAVTFSPSLVLVRALGFGDGLLILALGLRGSRRHPLRTGGVRQKLQRSSVHRSRSSKREAVAASLRPVVLVRVLGFSGCLVRKASAEE